MLKEIVRVVWLVAALCLTAPVNAQQASTDWTPWSISSAKLTLFPGYTDMLRQEQFGYSPSRQVSTACTANGDPCGSIFLPIDGHVLTLPTGASDAWRPTLQGDSSGGRNSFLRFGASSQGSMYDLQNSTGSFRFVHTIQQFTIAFFIRFQNGGSIGGDGVNNAILDSNSQAAGNTGFCVYRDTDDKLYFGASKVGTNLVAVSSGTTTLTADGNWHYVVIQCAGPGSNTCTMSIDGAKVGSGSPLAGAPFETDASFDLFIGQTAGATNRGQFDLDNLLITDTVVSASDLAKWAAFNPARTSTSLLDVNTTAGEIEASAINYAWAWWDCSTPQDKITQSSLIYADATLTRAVSNSGDTAGYVENRLGAHLKRALIPPRWTGTSPRWVVGTQTPSNGGASIRAATVNGRSYAMLNGSWNSGSHVSAPQGWSLQQALPPGDKTWLFAVMQTNDGPSMSPWPDTGQVGAHLFCYSRGNGTAYCAIPGLYHTGSPMWVTQHITGDSGVAAQASLYPTVVVSGTTNPPTAGKYLVQPAAISYGLGPTYYCQLRGQYLWYRGSYWVLNSTPSKTGSNYFRTATPSFIDQALTRVGRVSGTPNTSKTPVYPGPTGFNIVHGQQKGNKVRLGVNGYWGDWVSTIGSMVFDSIGPDGHQLPAGNPRAPQHFEFSGAFGEGVIVNYALPDHVTYRLMRGMVDKWNVQHAFTGN